MTTETQNVFETHPTEEVQHSNPNEGLCSSYVIIGNKMVYCRLDADHIDYMGAEDHQAAIEDNSVPAKFVSITWAK